MAVMEVQESPAIVKNARKLVQAHRRLKDEPLLLAVQYVPAKAGNHVYIFEIAEHFGLDTIDPGRSMFEVSYESRAEFPLEPGRELRLLLTNPTEWKTAVEKNWPGVKRLREAHRAGRAKVLFATVKGARLWSLIRG